MRTRTRHDAIDTPAGPLTIMTDGTRVVGLRLGRRRQDDGSAPPIAREARRQVEAYLAGRRTEFDLPFALDLPPFRTAVLETVHAIPFGEALSYGEVAGAVGNPRAARAVGQAVGANPLPLLIPCHRVLASAGRLGGFGGGLDWKRFLLRLEGVSWR
jgi:methylated-DNA-[protein]-cysteine S-methyltransferase